MIEAAMLWNEPNNKSHWDPELDPDWSLYARTVIEGSKAIAAVNPDIKKVLGGISPIDPNFIRKLEGHGALDHLDVIAVHGFPLDWNLWQIQEWPQRIADIEAVAPDHEIWVTEVGVGKTAELLVGRVPRIFWYSLFDLPQSWGATTRHREAEGSSYYRHFYMGLIREDGTPKPALEHFARHTPEMGIMQWFHYQDPRLDDAVKWLKRLGVTHLRTGLSWADRFREDALGWFDRQMEALQDFDITVTFCFTPEHLGLAPHHTSAPIDPLHFADFCAEMIERYAPAQRRAAVA